MKKLVLSLILLFHLLSLDAQEQSALSSKPLHADFVVGPYLILDGTIYESVFLTGVRIGKEYRSGLTVGIEYLAGNQEDLQGQLGTTHSAFGTISYFLKKDTPEVKFRPYIVSGAGFMEFKDFSADVYGIGFYLGAGIDMNFSKTAKGFLEPRYVNTGLMDVNGTHQLGVMWGVRARF